MVTGGTPRGMLSAATRAVLDAFQKAREAVFRSTIPALDVYPDGAATIENIVVNAASVTQSGANPVQFICGGWIVGVTVSASLSSGGALTHEDVAGMSAAIKINGSTDLFQIGQQGQGFVNFFQLGAGFQNPSTMFRVMAPIVQQVPYQVFFKNVGANDNITVSLTLWYCNTTSPPILPE